MSIYLLDSENVGTKGLDGIESLSEQDEVVIFQYHAKDTNNKMLKKIQNVKAKIKFINQKIHTKNAMDFEIVAYAGLCKGQNKKQEIIIISNDKGYKAAIELFNNEIGQNNVYLKSCIKQDKNINILNNLFQKYSKEENKQIIQALLQATSTLNLHNILTSSNKQLGLQIYKDIKDSFSKKELDIFLKSSDYIHLEENLLNKLKDKGSIYMDLIKKYS